MFNLRGKKTFSNEEVLELVLTAFVDGHNSTRMYILGRAVKLDCKEMAMWISEIPEMPTTPEAIMGFKAAADDVAEETKKIALAELEKLAQKGEGQHIYN